LRLRLAAGAVAVLAAAAGFMAWKGDRVVEKVLDMRFGATLPKPDYPSPRSAGEANLQDLDYLARLPEVDRSFTTATQAELLKRVRALRARAASLSRAQLFLGVAEAAAAADNAHTAVKRDAWREWLNSSPVRFGWFTEGLHVTSATVANSGLLGARVTAIDGFDPVRLARESSRYFGGPPEHARASSLAVLESPQALHELHPEAPDDRLIVDVVDAEGARRTVELPAVESGQAGEWRSVLQELSELPPSLRDPGRSAYSSRLADGVLYLHLWRIRDDDRGTLDAFIRQALGGAGDAPWRRIVLDLRRNGGGDYPTVYGALKELPKRLAPDGRLMILTDNTTFSAAIIAAALARHFAGRRAVLVGERPGDRMAFWAEGNFIVLPNSKIRVDTATAYHDWEHGCRELRCYWPNYFYDVAAGDVAPDIPVGWRFSDYRRGVDTVLSRALE
jgi:hypothetical protein